MNLLMGIELAAGRWISYPVGVRCLLTCQKPLSQPRVSTPTA
jgi:hypothetical protein